MGIELCKITARCMIEEEVKGLDEPLVDIVRSSTAVCMTMSFFEENQAEALLP